MTSLESSADVQDSPESPDPVKESPDSPVNGFGPGDGEVLFIRESPDSPDENGFGPGEEEVLFIEDRRPGNVDPAIFNSIKGDAHPVISEDYIKLNNKEERDDRKLIGIRSHTANDDVLNTDDNSMEELLFVEDRNPQLTGQDTYSPRYTINVSV